MFKLANQVLDAYDDVLGEGVQKIAKEFPKEASETTVMSVSDRDSLQDTDFALNIISKTASLKKFPVIDKDSTWLSNRYFDMNHMKLPLEAQKTAAYYIKEACARFGVEPAGSVVTLSDVEAKGNIFYEGDLPSVKIASPVKNIDLSAFAKVEDIANNYTSAQYVMSTPSRVKLAEKYFNEYHGKMPHEVRVKYAQAIQMRANELGMAKCAGKVGVYSSDHYSAHLDGELSKRAMLLEHKPVMKGLLQKFAGLKSHWSAKEFSNNLYAFDKKAGIDKYYGSSIRNAFEATLGLENPNPAYLYKSASGNLTASDLKKLAHAQYEKIASYFGKFIADEFKKEPEQIFESLPMDHKSLVVDIANGSV